MITRQKIGIFYVPLELVEKAPQLIADMFKSLNMVIVRAEILFVNKSVEYLALCDLFEEVPKGQHPTRYEARLKVDYVPKAIVLPGEDPNTKDEVFKSVRFVKEGDNVSIN